MKDYTNYKTSVILIMMILCMMLTSCTDIIIDSNNDTEASLNQHFDSEVSEDLSENITPETSDDIADKTSSEDVNMFPGEDAISAEKDASKEEETSLDTDNSEDQAIAHECNYDEVTVAPTCTAEGYTEYTCKECSKCIRQTVEALGHDETEWIVITEATASKKGLARKTCKRCGVATEKDIPVLNPDSTPHKCGESSYINSVVINPTCTTAGYTQFTCSCGKVFTTNEIAATGHDKGDWNYVRPATTTESGLTCRMCTRCAAILEEKVIPPCKPWQVVPEKYNVIATNENTQLLAEAVVYYVNAYRETDGIAHATPLLDGKMHAFATMRAAQLPTDFTHNLDKIRDICTELKFGKFIPERPRMKYDAATNTEYVDGIDPAHYELGTSEACVGNIYTGRTIADIAMSAASSLYNSKDHWSYVGASSTKYLSAGVYNSGDRWWVCVSTATDNKYDAWTYDDAEHQ